MGEIVQIAQIEGTHWKKEQAAFYEYFLCMFFGILSTLSLSASSFPLMYARGVGGLHLRYTPEMLDVNCVFQKLFFCQSIA